MWFWLIVVLVLLLLILWIFSRHGSRSAPPAEREPAPKEDAERRAREEAVRERGDELIERRVHLDTRRGTLAGFTGLDEALERLEREYRAGEISEQAFEAEKIRLLGG